MSALVGPVPVVGLAPRGERVADFEERNKVMLIEALVA
jgi:hypothetical protein